MRVREIIVWVLAGCAGVASLAWAFPRALPLYPRDWRLSRAEAVSLALARFEELGEPVADPYLVATVSGDPFLERRLLLALDDLPEDQRRAVEGSRLAASVVAWQVRIYERDAASDAWGYEAEIAPDGRVQGLRLNPAVVEGIGGAITPLQALARARDLLRREGFDLAAFGSPEVRSRQQPGRTDMTLTFSSRETLLGGSLPHGAEVHFAGDRLTGFSLWYRDDAQREIRESLRPMIFLRYGHIFLIITLLAPVGWLFLRRYHAGEVGVGRGARVFLITLAAGALLLSQVARNEAQVLNLRVLTRPQATWVWGGEMFLFFFFPMALLAFFCWAAGEAECRERWGHKLAAFDALLSGRWTHATVARSALRGLAAGALLTGLSMAATLPLREAGAWPQATFVTPWSAHSAAPSVAILAVAVAFGLYSELLSRLLLLAPLVRRFGPWLGGGAVALLTGVLYWPLVMVLPWSWALPLGVASAALLVALFLRYDFLTTLLCVMGSMVLLEAWPLLLAEDPGRRFHGWIAVLVMAAPLLVSVRWLGEDEELVYRYEDIPPHVRRIAERERQRVELETARGIQSSILPELPPSLNGVEIAHAYQPATEVGGDFYDVLALEDGRLAVAVGDVAGHGVSSGLIMSMARSALAVQVTFDPRVESVFATLNRMVYQSARHRLLTTLCYAVLDPARGELLYGSAGHLFPYLVSPAGGVTALESVAYPLGVRGHLEVDVRRAALGRGDSLFLFSDGVVEARPAGSDDLFGFARLEASLRRHAAGDVREIRDGVLRDLARHTGPAPRDDDQTLLVLRVA